LTGEFDQGGSGEEEGDAEDSGEGEGFLVEAKKAEVVDDQGGGELAGDDEHDESGSAEGAGEEDGSGDDDDAAGSADPGPGGDLHEDVARGELVATDEGDNEEDGRSDDRADEGDEDGAVEIVLQAGVDRGLEGEDGADEESSDGCEVGVHGGEVVGS